MRHQQVEKRQDNVYGVIGTLGFDCVVLVEKEGLLAINECEGQVTFDFSQVEYCGSATLALLLSWYRHGQAQNKPLVFEQLPQKVTAMLQRAGLQALLP